MDDYESLSHSRRNREYNVSFIPKCRRKTLDSELREHLGEVFRRLAMQNESRVEEGHLMPDHVHGYVKGKSAIHRARITASGFKGQHLSARGYFVSS